MQDYFIFSLQTFLLLEEIENNHKQEEREKKISNYEGTVCLKNVYCQYQSLRVPERNGEKHEVSIGSCSNVWILMCLDIKETIHVGH